MPAHHLFGESSPSPKQTSPILLKNRFFTAFQSYLYNDRDKNAVKQEFRLDLRPPGKRDDTIDLKVAGVEPTPGKNATTEIR